VNKSCCHPKYCPCNVEHVLDVKGPPLWPVGLLGNKAFMEGMPVLAVETVPEDGIEFTLSYPARIEEKLTFGVELTVVVDNISLVIHAFLGILIDKVHQLLFRELAFSAGVDVLLA